MRPEGQVGDADVLRVQRVRAWAVPPGPAQRTESEHQNGWCDGPAVFACVGDSTTGMTSSSVTGPPREGSCRRAGEEVTRAVRRGDIRGVELAAADGCRAGP